MNVEVFVAASLSCALAFVFAGRRGLPLRRQCHGVAPLALHRDTLFDPYQSAFQALLAFQRRMTAHHTDLCEAGRVAASSVFELAKLEIHSATIMWQTRETSPLEVLAHHGRTPERSRNALCRSIAATLGSDRSLDALLLAGLASCGIGHLERFHFGPPCDPIGVLIIAVPSGGERLSRGVHNALSLLWRAMAHSLHLVSSNDGLRHKSESESHYILGLSHDLRIPSTALLPFMERLRSVRRITFEDQLELDTAIDALNAQVSLLDDLFAVVRHEHDGPSMTSLPTDLERVIRPVLQIFQRACAEKNLQFNAAPPPPLLVDSHPRLLTRALMNLLSNAVRATNMGSVELNYTTTADRVDIHVIDTGCGVPSHLRSELFERWTSDRLDGGVGLYLTRIFAESWGGYILYRPGAPTGSHFTLGMRRSEQADANDPPPMLSSLLLIEDDLAFMRVLEREVHGVARSLRRATSLDAARRELRLNRPTFIIADRYLPDGDIETFLREADVAGTLPMIVLTGSCAPATRRDTPRSPLVEWIEKPFAPGMVREAITRLTARHLRGNAGGGQECLAVGR